VHEWALTQPFNELIPVVGLPERIEAIIVAWFAGAGGHREAV
jgi:hypothetical protein